MLKRLYKLIEARDSDLCAPDNPLGYEAIRELIEAQADRVALQAYRTASQIIMSEPLSETAPRIRKITLEYGFRKIGSPTVEHADITFDALSFEDARRQLARYLDGLRLGTGHRFSYWAS